MGEFNRIALDFQVTGSFFPVSCYSCGKEIVIIHIRKNQKIDRLQEFSCHECAEKFYESKAIRCYLCENKIQDKFLKIGNSISKRYVCMDHLDVEHLVSEKENAEKYDRFIMKLGKSLECQYCRNTFEVRNYRELHASRYVQRRMAGGETEYGGPFSCPICLTLIEQNKIRFCNECGEKTDNSGFCSIKCNIAFNEN